MCTLENIIDSIIWIRSTFSIRSCKTFCLFVLLSTFICTYSIGQEAPFSSINTEKVVKVAVRAHSGVEAAINKWSASADYLSNAVDGYTFQLIPLVGFDEMRQVVETNEVEFVLTSPTAYVDLAFKYDVGRIATLCNSREGNGYAEFGGVVFVRADRDDINLLRDVKGKSIMGLHEEAFGDWRMAHRELLEMGIDPFTDCQKVLFSQSGTKEEIIYEVLQGNVDVGTVRTGVLENMEKKGQIDLQNIKIIEPRADDFPLPHTTRLYPEWSFAALRNTDDDLARKVAIALLQIERETAAAEKGGYTGWKVPLSYHQVLALLHELKASPYEDHDEISLAAFIQRYWEWFLFGCIFVFGLTILLLYIARLNNKLTHLSANLELKVEQRACELRQSNQQLIIENKERKQAQETLQELSTRNEAIMAAVPDIIVEVDTNKVYTWANKSGFYFFGDDLLGKEAAFYFEGEQETYNIVQPLFEGGEDVIYVESWQRRKDGENRLLVWWCRTLKDADGIVSGVLSTARDITEIRMAEENLREKNRFIESIVNLSPDILYIYDIVEQANVYISDGIHKVLGHSVKEIQEMKDNLLSSLMHPDDFNTYLESTYPKYLTTKDNEPILHQYRMKDKNGLWHWLDCHEIIYARQPDGSPKQIFGVVHDITNRKQAEQQFQNYQTKLKALASELTLTEERLKRTIATELHDRISQSLAMCKLNLTAMLQDSVIDTRTRAILADITESLGQTLRESRELTSQLSYPTLTILGLERAIDIWLQEEIGEKYGLQTRFEDDEQDKPVSEDIQAVLFRSVRELLMNAVKHARADQVDVTIRRHDKDIVVSVSDNGVGFDVGNIMKTGGGFGLFSVKEALERLAGALHAESIPGSGCKITLNMPLDMDRV